MRGIPWSSRRIAACFLTVITLGGCSIPSVAHTGTDASAGLNPSQGYEAVDVYLQDQVRALGLPGAAVVVVQNGVQRHSAAFGHADESGRPMTAQTPVLLASTSKSLTAIAVMQQVEAGRLALDEPVQTYLPWFELKDSRASAITVRQLLHQTSGMASADTAFESSTTQDPEALEEGVRALSGSPLAGAPGAAFGYANANYNVLGLLVQTVSKQPFGDYMKQHVFGPLDMVHSHPTRSDARQDHAANGYSLWFGSFWRQTDVPAPTTGMPSTTMYSSAEDMGRQLMALLDQGSTGSGKILGQESVEEMFASPVPVDDTKRYAMGWFTRPLAESAPSGQADGGLPLLLEHQGEWGNSHTYIAMVPASGMGVALVINGNDTSAPSRLKAVDSNILRIIHGQPPAPTVIQEDWLQRYSWAVALALLAAQVLSLWLGLSVLLRRRAPSRQWLPAMALGIGALALDGFALWLCFIYAPARFDTSLAVIVRQFPDVGFSLVPALALALIWPVPRTIWLFLKLRTSWPSSSD